MPGRNQMRYGQSITSMKPIHAPHSHIAPPEVCMSKHVGCKTQGDLHLVLAQEWAVFVLLAAVVLVGEAVVIVVVVMSVVRLVLAVARLVEAKDVVVFAVVILVMAIILRRTCACQLVMRWLVSQSARCKATTRQVQRGILSLKAPKQCGRLMLCAANSQRRVCM